MDRKERGLSRAIDAGTLRSGVDEGMLGLTAAEGLANNEPTKRVYSRKRRD
ncbi:MAG: hypothetical protein RBU37_00855 [Myxococcota bacterium]|jgi:hypothetical protein|nr:hypothetical protein [Myxococcota bacterium]